MQDFPHRVPLDHGIEVDFAVVVEANMDGVGIAEKIVQVAEDLLIRAQKERSEVIGPAIVRVQLQRVADVAQIDELVNSAVRIAGDVPRTARRTGGSFSR